MARTSRLLVALSALSLAVAGAFAQAPPPAAEVRLADFGLSITPPLGWVQAKEVGGGLLARFTGPAPNADGKVLDLLISPAGENMTFEQVRDRAVAAYKTPQKNLKNAKLLGEPRAVATGGQKSWDIRIVFSDAQNKPVTFLERLIPVGNRVYSLRMAASGDLAAAMGPLFDAAAASLKFDAKITEAPDPKPFLELAAKLKGMRLTQLVPTEQYLITEFEGKPIGWLFTRFERAKFDGREGWYLRMRSYIAVPDGSRMRFKAWMFAGEDWSRESWHAAEIRESAEGKSELLFEETGNRFGAKATVKFRLPDGAEKSDAFTVPEHYLPAAVEPAFTVLAAREGKGEFFFTMHEPKSRTVDYVAVPGKPEELDKLKVSTVLRRVPGRAGGYTQYIDDAGRTAAVKAPEQPVRKAVDKATLLKLFPGATDLN